MNVIFEGPRRSESRLSRALRWMLFFLGVGSVTAALVAGGLYVAFSANLPNFSSIEDYRPKTVTQVFDQGGQLIGEFYRERRIMLRYDEIPTKLVQAVLASEDDRFFEHDGIDYWGILRAAIANLRAGRVVQGGSTITQQVAKSLIISDEGYKSGSAKKLSRKIREALLAHRLEANLTKEEILTLYLNQIFLGNQAYGVQAAAQNYFRKDADRLNIAEMALLAGLPQAPSRYSPFHHPERAKERREYVLRRMLEEGFVTQAELDEAKETPIVVYPAADISREVTPFFTEHVRRLLFEKYGEDRVLDEGLRVWTTVDVERYRAGEDSMYVNLRAVDKRQGYRGPLMRLPDKQAIEKFLETYRQELIGLDRATKLQNGEIYVGVVESIDRPGKNIWLKIGPHRAVLPLAGMRWARPVDPNAWYERSLLENIPKGFSEGDVLMVRAISRERMLKDRYATPFIKLLSEEPATQFVQLEQEPDLECALLSVQSKSGYVLAMIGGYSYERSEFNRALQACRQPGSSFKPIVYAAALDLKQFTASTRVLDAPVTFDDPEAQRRWKPNNFEVKFMGEVTVRTALQNSMNVPSIKVLYAVGLADAIAYAKKLGITTPLAAELGIALGQACVTMGDLTSVYTLFANYGERIPRRFITRITDRDGKELYDDAWYADPWAGMNRKIARAIKSSSSPAEQVIDRQTGYLITKLMRNVVMGGTGTPAQALGVPVAGKTGTTNDSFDAWFMGYTTEITTAAWVGYDDYVLPMGKYEQGGRAALPLWLGYMREALKSKRTPEFEPPEGIVFVRIDPKTGMRARDDTAGAVTEAYREGSEPKEFVMSSGEARPDEFFKVDN